MAISRSALVELEIMFGGILRVHVTSAILSACLRPCRNETPKFGRGMRRVSSGKPRSRAAGNRRRNQSALSAIENK